MTPTMNCSWSPVSRRKPASSDASRPLSRTDVVPPMRMVSAAAIAGTHSSAVRAETSPSDQGRTSQPWAAQGWVEDPPDESDNLGSVTPWMVPADDLEQPHNNVHGFVGRLMGDFGSGKIG